jgi:hypothetical protein
MNTGTYMQELSHSRDYRGMDDLVKMSMKLEGTSSAGKKADAAFEMQRTVRGASQVGRGQTSALPIVPFIPHFASSPYGFIVCGTPPSMVARLPLSRPRRASHSTWRWCPRARLPLSV